MGVIAPTYAGIFAYKSFKDKGKKTIYNPSLGTTYLMFLPTAIDFICIFATGIFPIVWTDWLVGAALGAGELLLLIVLPEGLLKNKNTSYPFTGKYQYGYFKKFID